jgi:NitT/TauT family transport system permease protein
LLIKVARNFGANSKQILSKIVAPAAFPYLATGLHMALGTAWVFLVAGEMVGVRSGLGFLIIDGRNQVRYDLVVASMLIIGSLGLVIDRLMRLAEMIVLSRFGVHRV